MSADEILVRAAVERDKNVLAAFLNRAAEDDNIDRFDVLGTLQDFTLPMAQVRAGQLFIALRAWTVVGLASVVFRHDGDVELDALLLDPAVDRDGAAGALLLACKAFTRQAKARVLCATVAGAAESVLARWGFAAAGSDDSIEGPVARRMKAPI